MNFGHKIAISYILFAAGMITMVIIVTSGSLPLVTDHYYEKEQGHNDHMQRAKNSNMLPNPLTMSVLKQEGLLQIGFPSAIKNITGQVHLYDPMTENQDVFLDINPDSKNIMNINISKFRKGFWQVKIKWDADGRAYFDEKKMYF